MKKKSIIVLVLLIPLLGITAFLFLPRKFPFDAEKVQEVRVIFTDFDFENGLSGKEEKAGVSPIPSIPKITYTTYSFSGKDANMGELLNEIGLFPDPLFFKKRKNASWFMMIHLIYRGEDHRIETYTLDSEGYLGQSDGGMGMRMHLGSNKKEKVLKLREKIESLKEGRVSE